MTPIFVEIPQLLIVGVQCLASKENGLCPKMWEVFGSLAKEGLEMKQPATWFGVETYTKEFQTEQKWFYLAGVEVNSLEKIPPTMVGKIVPAARYAVFEHKGVLPGEIGKTFDYVYREWLPKSDFVQAGPWDLERYGPKFLGPLNPESVMEICLPIRAR